MRDVGGIPGMTWEALATRDQLVVRALRERGIPTVVNLAGGYQEDGSTVVEHVRTIKVMAQRDDIQSGSP
jgi:hypothetical protein